jgi:hypothetical protein
VLALCLSKNPDIDKKKENKFTVSDRWGTSLSGVLTLDLGNNPLICDQELKEGPRFFKKRLPPRSSFCPVLHIRRWCRQSMEQVFGLDS